MIHLTNIYGNLTVSSTVFSVRECQDPVIKIEEFINDWGGSRENNDKPVW